MIPDKFPDGVVCVKCTSKISGVVTRGVGLFNRTNNFTTNFIIRFLNGTKANHHDLSLSEIEWLYESETADLPPEFSSNDMAFIKGFESGLSKLDFLPCLIENRNAKITAKEQGMDANEIFETDNIYDAVINELNDLIEIYKSLKK